MSIAALYDIPGNAPALEAVLQDVRRAGVEGIVVGGDVLPGPMLQQAVELMRRTGCPNVEEFFVSMLLQPPSEAQMFEMYSAAGLT